jgi:hypothetical protein
VSTIQTVIRRSAPFALLLGVAATFHPATGQTPAKGNQAALVQSGGNPMMEEPPVLAPEKELSTKITAPFTVAAVGDLTILRPIGELADPRLQAALDIIRKADLGFANFESNISDPPNYEGPLLGFMGVKEVAADIRSWGIDFVNKAGNHGFDSGPEGMMATLRLLEDAGVQYTGSGRNLTEARSARYIETAKGRIGAVGMHSVVTSAAAPYAAAADPWGNYVKAQAGQNTLRLSMRINASQEQVDALRKVQQDLYVLNDEITTPGRRPASTPEQVTIGGTTYRVGDPVGSKSYVMDPEDLRQQLRNIRGGKLYADFIITTIHAHPGKWIAEHYPEETSVPDFLIELARKSIDQGGDMFVGHGPHALRGIEIYKGKPIFYGLGQFVRQSDWRMPVRADYEAFGTTPETTDLSPAELGLLRTAGPGYRHRAMYESVIALSQFDGGKLQEVRLYPVDLGYERPLSKTGYPMLADSEMAQRVLRHLQKVSAPFGTTITIQGNVGVIRVAPPARR